jgi:hypothetical protein
MKRLTTSCIIALLGIVLGAPRASAATTLDVNITFTIADVITVTWAGGYTGFAAQTWAVGAVTLGGTYNTITPSGTWTDDLRITNTSTSTNTTVDIDLVLQSGPAAGWTAGTTAAADVYVVRAKETAASVADLTSTGSAVTTTAITDFINSLAPSGTTGEIDFLFQTPTTITTGAGAAQSITLRFTASVAN